MPISTNGAIVTRLAGALYNQQLSNATYNEVLSAFNSPAALNTLANYLISTDFASKTDLQIATTLVSNLSLTSVTGLDNWIAAQLTAAGTGNKGAKIISMLNDFSNISTTDATYGAAVTAFNTKIDAAQALSQTSGNTGSTFSSAGTTTSSATFTLTTGSDNLDPNSATAAQKTTAGDDTFRAPTDGFLTTADFIDGGAGNDSLTASVTAAGQTIAPSLKSVENVTLTVAAVNANATTFNAVDTVGITTLTVKDAAAISQSAYSATGDERVIVSNLAKTTTLGIVGGVGTVGATTASVIVATFAGAAAADTQKVAISSLGNTGWLNLATAETVQITATGNGTTGANTISTLSAGAVKTLNLLGSGDLTIGASDLAPAPTINASAATGVIAFTGETGATTTTFIGGSGATTFTTASTGIISVTTGAGADTVDISGSANTATINTGDGNDNVKVGVSTNITAADTIVGGAGTDTITISDATINATTKTTLALGVSGFEVLATTQVAEVTIDFNALSTYDVVTITTASTPTGAGAAGTAGAAAVAATMESTADQLIVAAARTGQVGAVATAAAGVQTSGAGGNGITITPRLDGGANIASIKFVGNADITGGAGGAGAAQTGGEADVGGAGGIALDAGNIETLNIDVSGTNATGVAADTVTLTGGAGGALGTGGTAGANGATVTVSTNATINVTSSLTGATAVVNNNLDLGTVVGTNATINASTFAGGLTVTAASGNVTINGGLGKDVLTGGAGTDTISGGAGADTLDGAAAADVYTGGAGRDSFAISNSGTAAGAFDTVADFGKVTSALTAVQVGTLSATNAFGAAIASATTLGGAETDTLLMAATSTLRAATTGTDVSGAVTTAPVVTGSISAKGVVTVSGAGASLVDTLGEWVAVANLMATTNGNVAVFEFSGSTYVYQQTAGATAADTLVQLVGVTGVTGAVVSGSAVAAVVGDIFVS